MNNRFIILSKEQQTDELLSNEEAIWKIDEQGPETEGSAHDGELFILWLFTQTRRSDTLGRLSRLIKEEILEKKHFPEKPTKYQIMLHLMSHNLNPEGISAFASAWDEFETLRLRFIKGEIDDI